MNPRSLSRFHSRYWVVTFSAVGVIVFYNTSHWITTEVNDVQHNRSLRVEGISINETHDKTIKLDSTNKTQTSGDDTTIPANRTKLILLWTKIYGGAHGPFTTIPSNTKTLLGCPHSCDVTDDKRRFNESDAVLFHVWLNDYDPKDLPKFRFPHQRFIMYLIEPPRRPQQHYFENTPPHFFNWTFTYRRNSDVYTNCYGDYTFRSNSLRKTYPKDFAKEESLDDYFGVNITEKSVMAAWFSSSCSSDVKREDFVKELQKYVHVDVYGRCGNLTCPKQSMSQCDRMLKKYLFYLSLENTLCHEYVTEKLWRPLLNGAVPIVYGAAHYSQFAPPHSYINAFDFETPAQLAEYLKMLERNRHQYARYFEWRRHFDIVQYPSDGACQLCKMLHDSSLPPKSYDNIHRWWFEDFPCNEKWQWSIRNPRPTL